MMTDNEIIKALECCARIKDNNCSNCPFTESRYCTAELATKVLTRINRQKAEIERLKDLIISNDEKNLSYVATRIKEERELIQIERTRILEAEIERLENKLFDANEGVEFYKANFMTKCEEIDKVKSEAIKEFAERLKAKATSTFYEEHKYVDTEDIDDLVEEMVGEGE